LGDGLVITIPPVENGFVQTMLNLRPDWNLMLASYGDRPLPAIVSCLFVMSAIGIGRGRFALGHGGMGIGAAILAKDLYAHNQLSVALSMLPTIAGGGIGAFYLPLERDFGNAKNWFVRKTIGRPKMLAGLLFATTSAPTLVTSFLTPNWSIFASAANWLTGNIISMLLPANTQANEGTKSAQPEGLFRPAGQQRKIHGVETGSKPK
jgi:hypothetical protein